MLRDRLEARVIIGAALLHTGLSAAGLPGWQCPIRAATGVPCPGCGLGTAIGLLLKGRWGEALSVHAFAPLFLFGFIVFGVIAILPARLHHKAVLILARVERRTALVTLTLAGLFIYWGLRLFHLA